MKMKFSKFVYAIKLFFANGPHDSANTSHSKFLYAKVQKVLSQLH